MISIAQIKAARLFLGWEQAELAEKSGVSLPTVQRIENPKFGPGRSRLEIVERIIATLEQGGIEFIRAEFGKGEGLRLRTSSRVQDPDV
jgi:transcriptional regulator with XRE-family HTH domain